MRCFNQADDQVIGQLAAPMGPGTFMLSTQPLIAFSAKFSGHPHSRRLAKSLTSFYIYFQQVSIALTHCTIKDLKTKQDINLPSLQDLM